MDKEYIKTFYRQKFGVIPVVEKEIALHTYNQMIEALEEFFEIMEKRSKAKYNAGYVEGVRRFAKEYNLPTLDDIQKWAKEESKIEPTGAEEFGRIMGALYIKSKIENNGDK